MRHRDPAALAAVFDAAAPRPLLVAMHLTRDSATAEDLVQTVFLQVLRDAAGFDLRRPVMPWLLALLEHRAADARRRAHRHHERADDGLLAVSRNTSSPCPRPSVGAVAAVSGAALCAHEAAVCASVRGCARARCVELLRANGGGCQRGALGGVEGPQSAEVALADAAESVAAAAFRRE